MSDVSGSELLKQFLKGKKTEWLTGFSDRCQTTVGQLRQIAYGNRTCSPELAVLLDRESDSKLPMQTMCPEPTIDWVHVKKVMRKRS